MTEQATKIYTVFADVGVQHFESGTLTPAMNQQLLRQLETQCSGVSFTARDTSEDGTMLQAIAQELEARKSDFDLVLAFGGLDDYRLVFSGLPTIAVYNFAKFSHLPYKLFEERGHGLTTACDRSNICKPAQSVLMLRDLAGKIRLLDTLAKMKRSTLLVITDNPYVDVHHGDLNRNTARPR